MLTFYDMHCNILSKIPATCRLVVQHVLLYSSMLSHLSICFLITMAALLLFYPLNLSSFFIQFICHYYKASYGH